MALVMHDVKVHQVGDQVAVDLQVDGDSSYPSGGYALPISPAAIGIPVVDQVTISPTAANQAYYWDYDAQKIVFTDAAGTQASGSSDQSARVDIRVRLVGGAQ